MAFNTEVTECLKKIIQGFKLNLSKNNMKYVFNYTARVISPNDCVEEFPELTLH